MTSLTLLIVCWSALHLSSWTSGQLDTRPVNDSGASNYIPVPDEQRLYETLMDGYEKSVRPVINSTTILLVRFGLHLNQIVGLDERHQVLTTNVFIDQEWQDENLDWDPAFYNGIRSIRIPAKNVWLPDTFIYNNADGGSTGFMKGTYVLVNYNGTILWPVPVKLKSSCKVDITYFPFDDQKCILRFGSWIYSGLWMDYVTMHDDRHIDLSSYVNNSEWDLLSVVLEKNIRTHSCCPDPHPDLTYILHMRRKTFYYIFNIIVPCIMLSILTLLTFWLPPTSGEKITLGLSVFLAFSMFMLLIAEEVPATSEAVPLIGIYLCVVMTLTSLSVIMAVMVINLYNRGTKTRRAPGWVRTLVLSWMSAVLLMRHDLDKVVENINLETEVVSDINFERNRRKSLKKSRETTLSSIHEYQSRQSTIRRRHSERESREATPAPEDKPSNSEPERHLEVHSEPEPEVIWVRRDDIYPETSKPQHMRFEMGEIGCNASNKNEQEKSSFERSSQNNHRARPPNERRRHRAKLARPTRSMQNPKSKKTSMATKNELYLRKLVVAEWQRIAAVIDRLLFWLYFLGTMVSYLVILIVVPRQIYAEWDAQVVHVPHVQSDSRYMM